MRPLIALRLGLTLLATPMLAQSTDSTRDKTFLVGRDFLVAGVALGVTAAVSHYDVDIARASQQSRYQGSGLRSFATNVSKVNETTLTLAGIATYGVSGIYFDVDDVRSHGADERIAVAAFEQGLEFMHRLIRQLGGERE